ncbi:UNVERIFIED_CONTAM: hypothetical protein RMT77_004735 [Armadillidium vulgare]
MNIINYILAIFGLHLAQVITVLTLCSPVMRKSINTVFQVTNAIQELGRKVSHAQWAKNPNENVVLSPLSITVILNLLMLGTNESTNRELKIALNYPTDLQEDVIHDTFKDVLISLPQSRNGVTISLNTKLFSREGSEILDSFNNVSKNWYFTETQNLDFRGSPIDSTDIINNWVSNSTKGKIWEVFSLPLNPNTVCVAYSVMFMNAAWENKFDINLTKNAIFNTGRKEISIPMMTSNMNVPYARDNEKRFEIIALPYEGKTYSMYILKPLDDGAISKLIRLENSMNSTYFDSLIDQMTTQKILVSIPRMRLNQNLDLKMDLWSLGVSQIFSRHSANFKRFSDKQKLFVSDVYHEALLDVTEHGTNDSPESEPLPLTSSTSPSERFVLDRPSIIFVRNNEIGLIIFWAKVIKPEALAT